MSQDQNNYEDSDRLSQNSEYQGAALGNDEPDIYDDDYIVDITMRMAPESESSDFSDFTEEEKKEQSEAQVNQGQQDEGEEGGEDWVVGEEQEENNSYWVLPEDSEHEPPNEA